ncbi:extended synaptotagmin-3-like isoform X2 [Dendronephthya gigantea]|uniref:extended synaptotagmin-3-like isoform X2 n=1 Tax=Dendronephthya gigantea TaxID=151771 RepID=UPI00106C0703|nr:extended synaptotagmin-3-like isoform X2 [Dendronephthya gigantea]
MTDVESGGKDVCTKEQRNENKQAPSVPITSKIRAYAGVISFLKYFGGGFLVWSVGHWDFNYAWLLSSIAFYTLWKCYKKDKKLGIKLEPEIIDANDASRMKDLPNWVFFPDVERAEWLNKFVAQLWPYVNEMVIKILKETVEPKIQESVPGMLKSIYFTEISLGNRAPRIGGIKVYTENVKRSEVIMDVDVIYSGDADFELSVKCVTVGIEDVQLRGTLRVIMSPLVPASPLIAGISVFFLDQPELDFNLTNLLNILDVPGLSNILRGAIGDVIASFCVLPNRITIPLLNDSSIFDLKYPMPKGVIRLEVIEARDLEKKDIGFLKKGSADPFVVVKIGSESFQTEVKKNTLSPNWSETFEFFVDFPNGQKIRLHLFDYDKASDNESMGYIELDISAVAAQGIVDLWMPLEETKSGELHVKCTWFTLSSDPKDLVVAKHDEKSDDLLANAALFVKLDCAKKLPVANKVKRSTSAMCKLTLGNKTVQSQVVEDTLNPVWDEFYRFLVFNAKYQELNIEVIDSNKEKNIGVSEIQLNSLIDAEDMSVEQPFLLRDSGYESSVVCELKLRALVNRKVNYDACEISEQSDAKSEAKQAQTSQEEGKPVPIAEKVGSEETANVRQRKPASAPTEPDSKPTIESKPSPGEQTGEIELSITHKDKILTVVVHSARGLQPCDSDGLADPYVRMYLLPEKSKSSRRKTEVVKNSLEPKFNESFEWTLDRNEVPKKSLEVIVKNDVSFFSRAKTTMGRIVLELSSLNMEKSDATWYQIYDDPDDSD